MRSLSWLVCSPEACQQKHHFWIMDHFRTSFLKETVDSCWDYHQSKPEFQQSNITQLNIYIYIKHELGPLEAVHHFWQYDTIPLRLQRDSYLWCTSPQLPALLFVSSNAGEDSSGNWNQRFRMERMSWFHIIYRYYRQYLTISLQ